MVISNRWRYFLSVQGREVEVGEGEISLGRSQSANVSVKDVSVSRNHALMLAKSGRLTVKDLNSSNGTFLNGMRIFAEAELHDGDTLTLGESEMRVRILPPESVAATMRIDPRALLAGEELRLQAEEEAKAALTPGAAAVRSPLPPPPSAVSHVPRPSAAAPAPASPRTPPPSSVAPASAETGPTPLPARPAAVPQPAPAAAPARPAASVAPSTPAASMPLRPTAPAPPPMTPMAPLAAPPPAPPLTAQSAPPLAQPAALPPRPVAPAMPPPPPLPASAPSAPPKAATAAPPPQAELLPSLGEALPSPDAALDDAFGLPDLDLPPLPPVDPTAKPIVPQGPPAGAAPAIALTTKPAGFWIRAVAVLLDSLLLSLVCGGLFLATGNVLDDEQRLRLVGVVWFGLDLVMRFVGWSVWGTTPGKWLLGIHVFPARSSVPGIGFGKGLLRCLGYWVSGATLGVGFLLAAFTQGKRSLHDMIAGTTVGRKSRAA